MGFQLDNIDTVSKEKKERFTNTSFLQKEITFFSKVLSNKVKENFYTELSVLLKAGIVLKDSLELIGDSVKKKALKLKFKSISESIITGSSLSEAIRLHKEFTNYEYHSLKIGEETGTLNKITEQLASFYSRKNEQQRNLISALTYPAIILTTAFLVVVFMLHYVVPMFQDIFVQQKVELPAITKFIISSSEFMKNYSWLFLIIIMSVFLSRTLLNKKKWFKTIKDKLVLKLPFVGEFIRTIYLSQFTQAVTLLTASKVPLVNSIKLVKEMINFYPLQNALEHVEQSILKGHSLSESLKAQKFFDDKMVAMVKVAEETNQNEFIFERLNAQYQITVEQKSKLLSTLMEPIIIMVVGVLVGVILVAMYLPMFKLSSVMG